MVDYRAILKEKRMAMGISQNKLAQRVGITQTFMSEIESGRKSPSIEVFFQLCEVLEIEVFPSAQGS